MEMVKKNLFFEDCFTTKGEMLLMWRDLGQPHLQLTIFSAENIHASFSALLAIFLNYF